MLTRLGTWSRRWAADIDPWTDVYGLARTLLALGTVLTLVFTPTHALFRPGTGMPDVPVCSGARAVGLFCLAPNHLELTRWLAVALLLVVAVGYRPRFTGLLHAWVAFSFQTNALMVDGGDQVCQVMALILIPVTLTDGRRWHWERSEPVPLTPALEYRRLVALMFLWLARLQVAGIYFHAAVAKFSVAEWTDGTALYYWLLAPGFGAAEWLAPLLEPLLTHAITVTLLTWLVLLVEYLLSTGLVAAKPHRKYLLWAGLTLHGAIMLVHGLISFGLAMFAALILYLRPVEWSFQFAERLAGCRARLGAKRGSTAASEPSVST
ncbi:MAG: sporulation-delaying protein SdpB family protein [Archangium sp.]